MEKISIKNICGHNVGITVEDLRFHRVILPNNSIKVDREKFEEMITYSGVQALFDSKYLMVEDTEAALDMGLISEDQVEIVSEKPVQTSCEDAAEIEKIVNEGTDFRLKKLFEDQPEDRKLEIANIASRCKNLTYSKMDIIKAESGIDLSKILRG